MKRFRSFLPYFVVLTLSVLGILAIVHFGEDFYSDPAHKTHVSEPTQSSELAASSTVPSTVAPTSASAKDFSKSASKTKKETLTHLLLALIVIIVAAKALGFLFAKFKQPAVMGEVLAGIALGPSILGHISPEAQTFLMPNSIAPILSMIAQMGVIIFMFLVGVELDTRLLKKKGEASMAISHASIVFPFILGAGLAFFLFPTLAPPDVPFAVFTVFLGVAMSVTAFPVLARILSDLKIKNSPMANLVLTCAAVDDATAWCLLAMAIGIAQSNFADAAITLLLSLLFVWILMKPGRQLIQGYANSLETKGSFSSQTMVVVILAILTAALCTEAIGIHALFGPFLLGAMVPKESRLAEEATSRLEHLTTILLLPAFFAFTGMRTEIGLVQGLEAWMWCGLIIVVATVGKIGGATLAARWTGVPWREAGAIGVLMNTRGLMELIILNIGLDLGVLSPTLFTMMVLMAVVTTLMTCPLFHWITKARPWHEYSASKLDVPLAQRSG